MDSRSTKHWLAFRHGGNDAEGGAARCAPTTDGADGGMVQRSLIALGGLCAGAFLLVFVGIVMIGNLRPLYLVWNLTLALTPLVLALGMGALEARGHVRGAVAVGVPWLLFLPNSPYIFTDFIHLVHTPREWAWAHLAVLVWYSFTALFAGLLSLRLVHDMVLRRWGAHRAWTFVILVSLLTGVGVALGRFDRWNSWDAFWQPGGVVRDALRHVPILRPVSVRTLFPWVFGTFFGAAYLVIWSLTPAPSRAGPDRG